MDVSRRSFLKRGLLLGTTPAAAGIPAAAPAAPPRGRPPPGRTARRDSSTEFYFSCLEWISAYSQTECTVERPRTPFAKLTIIS